MYCVGRDDRQLEERLLDRGDLLRFGQVGRVVDEFDRAVGAREAVLDARRRGDQRQAELALEALLDDLHVQQAEEAAPESEPERTGRLGRVGDRRVVELELLERLAQVLEVVTVDREQAGEHHRLRVAVAGEHVGRPAGRGRDRLTRAGVADVLDAGDEVADLAGPEFVHRGGNRAAGADLDRLVVGAGLHERELGARDHLALHDPHARHDAAVLVELGVEDQALQRCVGVADGRRDALDDRVEQVGDALAGLGRHPDDLLGGDAEDRLDLAGVPVGIGGGQVDLVERGDDLELVLQREVAVGERLRLDPLRGVDHEDDALAGGEAATDLVAEVDVTGGVDQVEDVALPVDTDVLRLDGDAALALEVHRVEVLRTHVAGLDGAGDLEDPVGQRRLAMVDVRNDREVADAIEVHGPANATGHRSPADGAAPAYVAAQVACR